MQHTCNGTGKESTYLQVGTGDHNNAIKHVAAKKLSVHLSGNNRYVAVTIQDNGKGFAPSHVKDRTGLGLQNITGRVEIMNGKLYLQTEPGKGTNYLIEIPNN